MTAPKISSGDEFIVVKAETEASSSPGTSTPSKPGESATEEDTKCPEILYKVQYKDYSGRLSCPR